MCLGIYFKIILAALFFSACFGQRGSSKKPKKPFIKSDLKYIGCDVCERFLLKVSALVETLREQAPYKKIHEDDIADLIEKVIDPSAPEGIWASHLDLVSSRDYAAHKEEMGGQLYVGVNHMVNSEKLETGKDVLLLVEHTSRGRCEEECETIAKSASLLIQDEIEDFVENLVVMLWKGAPSGDIIQKVCVEWSGRCKKGRKPIKEKRKDYQFKKMTSKELEKAKLMDEMGDLAKKATLYDREDMENMMDGYDGIEDYESEL